MIDHEEYPHGSAQWATEEELRRAGLLAGYGASIGYFNGQRITADFDSPGITIAGSGGGKTRDVLVELIRSVSMLPLMALDPRGELFAIVQNLFLQYGGYAFSWNGCGLHDNPLHRCNPLDVLQRGDPKLVSKAQLLAEALIPLSGSAKAQYFERRARDWITALLLFLVARDGQTDFARLMGVINLIESKPDEWDPILNAMLQSEFECVRRAAGELDAKQSGAPQEFGGVMGEIYGNLQCLNDPLLLDSLKDPDFSLSDLSAGGRPVSVFLNVPADYIGTWGPIIRVMFTVAMLYKSERPSARRVMMIIDEAGQLGNFESLKRAYTYGRGAGIRPWSFFQDLGQIRENFGPHALPTFLGSSQVQQFFAIRDPETARFVSEMLGDETLHFNDDLQRAAARRARQKAMWDFMDGEDPLRAAFEYRQADESAQHRKKKMRRLMTPDELLVMGEDQQLIFVSGLGLRPIAATRCPYFRSREAGQYLPNPLHPRDTVSVPGLFGWRDAPVIEEPVPPELQAYPQYRTPSGLWRYVKGCRPI